MSPTARETLLRDIPEKDWQGWIVLTAQTFGWLTYHPLDSRGSAAGFPDLTLVRGDELMFVEVKRETGKVSAAQQRWLDALRGAGVEVHVWRPSDQDTVLERLRGKAA